MDTKPRLGRGLTSLLGEDVEPANRSRATLTFDQIEKNPHQARKAFDEDEINQLSESIRNHGVLQPLVVRAVGEHYELIAGERRLRAAQVAGLREVPVTIVNFDDQQVFEASLVENIQRSDLNPIEKAFGFKEYLDRYHVTQEQLANRLGMDRTSVSNLVNLLNLPEEVQTAVRQNQISLGHAKILKGLPNEKRQVELCKEIVMKGLSVKALELIVKQQKAEAEAHEAEKALQDVAPSYKTAHVQTIETELRQRFATRVEIKVKDKDRGQIVIAFDTNEDFERLVETLRR
ncbi:MAG: ParB/RepB/Spo0J family partition protein [Gemmataceae bacterium]|nr:ParB/RepB/Spo0J family partition protein [Gemmataceae bacterium]